MSERLHDDDLEIIVGAVEALSAKLDSMGKRPVTIDHKALAELIVGMNAETRNAVADRLNTLARRLDASTAALEQEGGKSEARLLQQRIALMHETSLERERRKRWQWIGGLTALLLLATLIAGPWLAHGYFVRTVSGCNFFGGIYKLAEAGSGYVDFCGFEASEPR